MQGTDKVVKVPVPTRDEIDAGPSEVAQPAPPKPSKNLRKRTEDAAAHERARKRSGEND